MCIRELYWSHGDWSSLVKDTHSGKNSFLSTHNRTNIFILRQMNCYFKRPNTLPLVKGNSRQIVVPFCLYTGLHPFCMAVCRTAIAVSSALFYPSPKMAVPIPVADEWERQTEKSCVELLREKWTCTDARKNLDLLCIMNPEFLAVSVKGNREF